MEQTVTIHDLTFEPYLSSSDIGERIEQLGKNIAADFQSKTPLFIAVLNGAFMFAADLIRACNIECEITFIRLSSYTGTRSTGEVKSIVGLKEEIKGRDIIVVEDIVDTGKTLSELIPQLTEKKPASISIATLLDKPAARTHDVKVDYRGFEVPDRFVLGYGLDYNGLGRNLKDLYQLKESS